MIRSDDSTSDPNAPLQAYVPYEWARQSVEGLGPEDIERLELSVGAPERFVITEPDWVLRFLEALRQAMRYSVTIKRLYDHCFTVVYRPELRREPVRFFFQAPSVGHHLGEPFAEALRDYESWRNTTSPEERPESGD